MLKSFITPMTSSIHINLTCRLHKRYLFCLKYYFANKGYHKLICDGEGTRCIYLTLSEKREFIVCLVDKRAAVLEWTKTNFEPFHNNTHSYYVVVRLVDVRKHTSCGEETVAANMTIRTQRKMVSSLHS